MVVAVLPAAFWETGSPSTIGSRKLRWAKLPKPDPKPGRVRQHDHGQLHGDAAVSGRLDGAVAEGVWLEPGAGSDLRVCGCGGAVSWDQRPTPARQEDPAGLRNHFPDRRGGLPAAHGAELADSAVLVLR